MKVYVIEDKGAAERNSFGFFVMKNSLEGSIFFCCEEFLTKTDSLDDALNWGQSISRSWSDWKCEDKLVPATLQEIIKAGIKDYIKGIVDTKTGLYIETLTQ